MHDFAIWNTNTNTLQSDKIVELTNAAGTPVEPIWAQLLAKALEGKDVKDMLTNVGAGSGPAVAAPAAAAGGDAAAPAEEKKEEKKEEKEESDEDVRIFSPWRHVLTRSRWALVSSTKCNASFMLLLAGQLAGAMVLQPRPTLACFAGPLGGTHMTALSCS